MARLMVGLLGTFTAEMGGRPVDFAYGKVKALLAYLALDPGRTVSREKLSGILWPDQPQEIALDNLRQALSRLRKSLNDKLNFPPFLVADREKVRLNSQADLQVDVVLFKESLAFCSEHVHRHSQTCPTCANHIETACNIYRGEFLENLSMPDSDLFEDWVQLQRARLHGQMLEALGWLAKYALRLGDHLRALDYARRQVALEPLNERSNLSLMNVLVGSGKSDQALSHYRWFEQRFTDEMGQTPSRPLVDYYERIRSGEENPDAYWKITTRDLPSPLNPIIGRQVELNELEAWLSDPTRRLITILGPGGAGKTRLAIEIARKQAPAFADGVIFIDLSNENSQASLASQIAKYANLSFSNEQEILEELTKYLMGKDLLLVLDGLEHVQGGREFVNWLLQAEQNLVVLVTSRERLNLPGEWVLGLGGLAVPPLAVSEDVEKYSAVELFVLRARQSDPSFELTPSNQVSVGRICSLVDGMPLAISLASSWARTLPCEEIARELQNNLDLLSTPGQLLENQTTSMRAAFDQSWNRLTAEEQRLFWQVAVFKGGFDRQSAEAVCGATLGLLASLVDKSFLLGSPEGRYNLHDLLHQYGLEKLSAAGETERVSQRHFEYFLQTAEQNEANLQGDDSFKAFFWLVKERSNLHAAYEWASAGTPARDPIAARRLSEYMHLEMHKAGVHEQDSWASKKPGVSSDHFTESPG